MVAPKGARLFAPVYGKIKSQYAFMMHGPPWRLVLP